MISSTRGLRNIVARCDYRLLLTIIFCAPVTVPDRVWAQEATTGTLEEIVVTAEKRDSTVLKTPISITAISSQQIVAQGLNRLEDIAAQTPGISMKQFSPGETEYEMRGLPSSGDPPPQ